MSLAGTAPVTRSSVVFQTGFENDYYLLLNVNFLHGGGIVRKFSIYIFLPLPRLKEW